MSYNVDEHKSNIRDLKLRIIDGLDIKVSDVSIKRFHKELRFISRNFLPTDVLSGSLALRLYGLLDRKHDDIDIIIDDETRYSNLRYGCVYANNDPNRLGFKFYTERRFLFFKEDIVVDFFKNNGVSYNELCFEGNIIRIQDPIDIINFKFGMYTNKHFGDLSVIFNNIQNY